VNNEVISSEIRIQFNGKRVVVLRCEKGERENIININKRMKVIRIKRINKIMHNSIRNDENKDLSKR
jgi:hypothetical protein